MLMLGVNWRRAAVLASAAVLVVTVAGAEDVVRTPLPDGNPFPISAAVTVPAGYDTVYVSGALPDVINKDAPKGSVEAYGDMATQAEGVLGKIKASLAELGLSMVAVSPMTVFMVADPTKDNKLDFAGLMTGYTKFFGTAEQPNKPARSAVQVAALVAPGALLEIEVIAVKPHKAEAHPAKTRKGA
jgi:enamine deaminase RidA (YjgF/YER057c/UK114 family)